MPGFRRRGRHLESIHSGIRCYIQPLRNGCDCPPGRFRVLHVRHVGIRGFGCIFRQVHQLWGNVVVPRAGQQHRGQPLHPRSRVGPVCVLADGILTRPGGDIQQVHGRRGELGIGYAGRIDMGVWRSGRCPRLRWKQTVGAPQEQQRNRHRRNRGDDTPGETGIFRR